MKLKQLIQSGVVDEVGGEPSTLNRSVLLKWSVLWIVASMLLGCTGGGNYPDYGSDEMTYAGPPPASRSQRIAAYQEECLKSGAAYPADRLRCRNNGDECHHAAWYIKNCGHRETDLVVLKNADLWEPQYRATLMIPQEQQRGTNHPNRSVTLESRLTETRFVSARTSPLEKKWSKDTEGSSSTTVSVPTSIKQERWSDLDLPTPLPGPIVAAQQEIKQGRTLSDKLLVRAYLEIDRLRELERAKLTKQSTPTVDELIGKLKSDRIRHLGCDASGGTILGLLKSDLVGRDKNLLYDRDINTVSALLQHSRMNCHSGSIATALSMLVNCSPPGKDDARTDQERDTSLARYRLVFKASPSHVQPALMDDTSGKVYYTESTVLGAEVRTISHADLPPTAITDARTEFARMIAATDDETFAAWKKNEEPGLFVDSLSP